MVNPEQKTQSELSPEETSYSEWDQVAELADRKENIELNNKNESSLENGSEVIPNREQQLLELRDQISDLAVSESEQKSQIETMQFVGQDIPVEKLGLDKILFKEIRPRSKYDFLGKRKDRKILDQLYDSETDEEFEKILSKSFSPEVAALFLEDALDEETAPLRISSEHISRMLESLPLQDQALYFQSDKAYTYMVQGVRRTYPESIMYKLMASTIGRLETGDSKKIGNSGSLHQVTKSLSTILDSLMIDDQERMHIYKTMCSSIDALGEPNKSISKVDSATELLSQEYFFQHISEIVDDDILADLDMSSMCAIQQAFGPSLEKDNTLSKEQQEKYDTTFPKDMRELASILDGSLTGRVSGLKEDDVSKLMETIESYDEIIKAMIINPNKYDDMDERFGVATLLLSEGDGAKTVLAQSIERWPLDDGLMQNIQNYLQDCFVSCITTNPLAGENESGLGFNNIEISDIEELRDFDSFLEGAIGAELANEEYDSARRHLAEYAFGASTTEICRDLIALGIFEIENEDEKEAETEDVQAFFSSTIEQGVIRINPDQLDKLSEYDDYAEIILDVMDLVCCPDQDLAERFSIYSTKHVAGKEKIGKTLDQIRERITKEASLEYSKYMQKAIKEEAHLIGSDSYEGQNIPILEMQGDEFMLLIHRLGAYSEKDADDPSVWNTRDTKESRRNQDGRPVGYISTCAVANQSLHLAGVKNEGISNPEEIFYAFTDFGEDTLQYTAQHDLWTSDDFDSDGVNKILTRRQDYFYPNPRDLIAKTQENLPKNAYGHNEVVLDRYSGDPQSNEGRLQPNYLVVFSNDPSSISERTKKHAAYFHVPIIIIDPQKYA